MPIYEVVVRGSYGLRDVIARFRSREKAERFLEKLREVDRDVNAEIVEVKETGAELGMDALRLIRLVVTVSLTLYVLQYVLGGVMNVVLKKV
jgi:uncharacterized protein YfcZ (UPF0381/DUF406 family)